MNQTQFDKSARKNEGRLFRLGALSVLIYGVAFLKPYYLDAYFDVPLLDLAKISSSAPGAALLFAGAFLALFLLYYGAVKLCLREMGDRSIFLILANGTLFSLVMTFVYPIGAADIFGYISHGRLKSIYGLNPFIYAPSTVPGDPFFIFNAWPDETSTYGPVWGTLSAVLAAAGQNSLWSSLILFKLAVILFYLGCGILVYKILQRQAPQYARAGAVMFAWNPLVVFEIAANGHNDTVMIFFLLLAILLLTRERIRTAVVFLTVSALTKFVTAPLLLLLLVFQINRTPSLQKKIRVIGEFALIVTVTTIILYAPYWQGPVSIGFLRRADLYTSSFAAIGRLILEPRVGDALARTVAGGFAVVSFGVCYVVLLFKVGNRLTGMLSTFFECIFFYLTLATLWFQPWYLVWLVALGALLDDTGVRTRTILFSLCAALSYLVWQFILIWNWSSISWLAISAIAVATIFVPPIGLTIYQLLRASRRIREETEERGTLRT